MKEAFGGKATKQIVFISKNNLQPPTKFYLEISSILAEKITN